MLPDCDIQAVCSLGERAGSAVVYRILNVEPPAFVYRIHSADGGVLEFDGGSSEEIAMSRAHTMLLSWNLRRS